MNEESKGYIKIHPDKLITYTRREYSQMDRDAAKALKDLRKTDNRLTTHEENFSNNDSFGILSRKAKANIRNAASYMVWANEDKQMKSHYKKTQQSRYKLNFTTLTLPSEQVHTDQEIKKYCLDQFFTELRRKYDVKLYLWKAETQENGNIHFHIMMARFIPWQDIRAIWNRVINKGKVKGVTVPFSYVDTYRRKQLEFFKNGFLSRPEMFYKTDKKTGELIPHWSYEQQRRSYYNEMAKPENERFTNPNTTDIHPLYKVKSIQAYISQYIAKNDDEELLTELKKLRDELRQIELKVKEVSGKIEEAEAFLFSDQLDHFVALREELNIRREQIINEMKEFRYIQGRIWNLSRELSALIKGVTVEIDNIVSAEITKLWAYGYELEKHHNKTFINSENDFFTLFYFDHHNLRKANIKHLIEIFERHVHETLKQFE